MDGSFFVGFSGVLLPYTILYTRARDGVSSRPTEFLLRPMEFLLGGLQLLLSYA
jgi:hypothetical protein